MAALPGILMPHRIVVEPFAGDSSEGPTYGPAKVSVQCRREGRIDVTADGQHTGSVKLYARLVASSLLNTGARVTLDDGTVGYVTAVARHEDGGLGAWEHVEATVQGSAP